MLDMASKFVALKRKYIFFQFRKTLRGMLAQTVKCKISQMYLVAIYRVWTPPFRLSSQVA